jgi:hypothetical protein
MSNRSLFKITIFGFFIFAVWAISTMLSQPFWENRIPTDVKVWDKVTWSFLVAGTFVGLLLLIKMVQKPAETILQQFKMSFVIVILIMVTGLWGSIETQFRGVADSVEQSDEYVTAKQNYDIAAGDAQVRVQKKWGLYSGTNKKLESLRADMDGLKAGGAYTTRITDALGGDNVDPKAILLIVAIVGSLVADLSLGWLATNFKQAWREVFPKTETPQTGSSATNNVVAPTKQVSVQVERDTSPATRTVPTIPQSGSMQPQTGSSAMLHCYLSEYATENAEADAKRARIRQLHNEGKTKSEIARVVAGETGNCSRAYVQQVLKDEPKPTYKTTKTQRMQMLKDYLEDHPNASLAELADAVGVSSRETVRRYLNELGLRDNQSRNQPKFSKN